MTHLNYKMAKAMGLPIYAHLPSPKTPYPYFVDANGLLVLWKSALFTVYWQPAERIEQAMMVLEHLKETLPLLAWEVRRGDPLERDDDTYHVSLYPINWPQGQTIFVDGQTKKQAICLAIEATMKELGDAR